MLLTERKTQLKCVFRNTMEVIQWRTGLRFLNEAARCLEEKIITSPVSPSIDFLTINLIGFC